MSLHMLCEGDYNSISNLVSAMARVISLLIGHMVESYINLSLAAICSQQTATSLITTTTIRPTQVSNNMSIVDTKTQIQINENI